MEKSPDAFRTISEVAELLETPAHVLRFWESRFPQIRPVKRAGGRRYYRPADVALLTGIKQLLHDDGMTIRGVQKILREQGVKHVAGVVDDAGVDDDAALEAALAAMGTKTPKPPLPAAEAETAQIIALQTALNPIVDREIEDQGDLIIGGDVSESDETLIPEDASADANHDVADAPAPPVDPDLPLESLPEPETVFWKDSAQPVPEPEIQNAEPAHDLFSHPGPSTGPSSALTATALHDDDTDGKDPVDEAPMSLWAEPEDIPEPSTAHITPFPPPPETPQGESSEPESGPLSKPDSPAPVLLSMPDEPVMAKATLAARLRAQKVDALSPEDRETLTQLLQTARDLRKRMVGFERPGL